MTARASTMNEKLTEFWRQSKDRLRLNCCRLDFSKTIKDVECNLIQINKMDQVDALGLAASSNVEGVDLEHISLKDLFTQINSMTRDIDSGLDIIKTNMESLRLEIHHDTKMMKTDIEEVKRSVNRSWEEIEEMKSLMSKQREDVDVMKTEILLLKGQVKKERDRNTRLEQYTRRENIRLLNVKETEDENTEALFNSRKF